MCSVGQFLCAYLELLQSQNAVAFTTALSQTAYLSKEFCSFNLCRMMTSIPTTIVVECVPTELVGTHQVCFNQVPIRFVVAGFPTMLAVTGISTRLVVAIFPTTSLVGKLPQQGLWDWHTI